MRKLKGKKTVLFNIVMGLVTVAENMQNVDFIPGELDNEIIKWTLIGGNVLLRFFTDTKIGKSE